ncbi:hypothetical protein V3C99_018131 [Haemonchus contortus]|uniref:Reverse transcriptase n=1 Tax=Haemonchus contortus TaxID=6289 RepID=A0A7I4Z3K3_HAECO|nr:hypothetical protein HCOI_01339500 [Haemonchus contortus]
MLCQILFVKFEDEDNVKTHKQSRREDAQAIGTLMPRNIRVLLLIVPALIDSGSMVNIIPISLLEKAQKKGYEVDTLPTLTESEVGPVYEASGNEMEIVGAVTVEAELEGGRHSKLVLHITPLPQDEVLLGMNVLEKLGVQVSITNGEDELRCKSDSNLTANNEAKVIGRTYVPSPTAIVEVDCEGVEADERASMVEQLKENMGNEGMDEELMKVLIENEDAFAVSEKELSHTPLTEMDVGIGDNPLIKLKARPVPLSIRPMLTELLEDLQKRSIIENSQFISMGFLDSTSEEERRFSQAMR